MAIESSTRCTLDGCHPTVSLGTGRRAKRLCSGSGTTCGGGGDIEDEFSRLAVVENGDGATREVDHTLGGSVARLVVVEKLIMRATPVGHGHDLEEARLPASSAEKALSRALFV